MADKISDSILAGQGHLVVLPLAARWIARRVDASLRRAATNGNVPDADELLVLAQLRMAGDAAVTRLSVGSDAVVTDGPPDSVDRPLLVDDLCDIAEAAVIIGCEEHNVRRRMASGALRTVLIGSVRLLDRRDVEIYRSTRRRSA